MRSGFRDFLRSTVKNLQGDQEKFQDFSMKANCRELLKKDARDRKAKRKNARAARRGNR
jgi:hypothetical protein